MTEISVFILNSQTKGTFLESTVINPEMIPYTLQKESLFLFSRQPVAS